MEKIDLRRHVCTFAFVVLVEVKAPVFWGMRLWLMCVRVSLFFSILRI